MKRAYLPEAPHKEKPQQRDILRPADPRMIIEKAAALLECDPDEFIASKRMYGPAKTNRDLVMVLIWESGVCTNEAFGNLFMPLIPKSAEVFRLSWKN